MYYQDFYLKLAQFIKINLLACSSISSVVCYAMCNYIMEYDKDYRISLVCQLCKNCVQNTCGFVARAFSC